MTELTIIPKISDKTARFKGTVAAGEHVAVTIKGGAAWIDNEDAGAHLSLRVLDLVTGHTLAVFPYWTEDNQSEWEANGIEAADAWDESEEDPNDLYCELNLNTNRMVAAARHMLRVPVLFVLGEKDEDNPATTRTLYFRDRYIVEFWPERIGDDTPYDLDAWPKKIDEWTELINGWTTQMSNMKVQATPVSNGLSVLVWDGTGTQPQPTVITNGQNGQDGAPGEVQFTDLNERCVLLAGGTESESPTNVMSGQINFSISGGNQSIGSGSGGVTVTDGTKSYEFTASGNSTGNNTVARLSDVATKQNTLTFDPAPTANSTNPVTSGGVKTAIDAVVGDVADINDLIPSAASSSNQLADKAFVNSSIATNTANYISDNGEPFESVTALNAYSGTKTNNDYAFVVGEDSAGNTTYTRYKWTGSAWAAEYVLNNSSFTSAQWAAITSGITSSAVTKLSNIESGAQVNVIETVKVNGTALTPSSKAVDVPIPSTTQTLAQEEYDSTSNSVTVDTPSRRDVKLKIRNVLSNTVNTLDTSASGTIATREWVQQNVDVPSPSDADPAANGAAWEGESDNYSRADHVHPTDTSRQASITASGILKGDGSGGVTAAVAGTDYQAPLAASTATPLADGTASAGSSAAYARGDHVHPTDTSRAPLGALADAFDQALGCSIGQLVTYADQLYRSDGLQPGIPWDPTSAELVTIAEMLDLKLDVSGQFSGVRYAWGEGATGRALKLTVNQGLGSEKVYEFYRSDSGAPSATCVARLGDLDGKLSTAGATRSVTAEDSGGTETYAFVGTGDVGDADAVARMKELPYVNVGEAAQMLAGVYGILSRGVQRHTATSGETSATFGFADTPGTGKIADAILEIDNSGNTSALGMEFSGLGTTFTLVPPDGDDLAEMTSVDGGKRARFYFTETALVSNNLPVISVQRITLGAVATAITRGS